MADRMTSEQAATIAARHGLTPTDALALRGLTDDADEAESIAAKFAQPAEPDPAAEVDARLRDAAAHRVRKGTT